jgi:hypothetical protein
LVLEYNPWIIEGYMNISILLRLPLVVSLLLLSVAYAWSTPVLTIKGQGNVFEVRGEGLEGVGGIDVTVGYDTANLANPRVAVQGLAVGAMMVPNLNTPGVVRIGIITPNPQGLSGSGSILGITFDSVGGRTGQITSFTAHVVAITGVKIEVQTRLLNPGDASAPLPGDTNPTSVTASGPQISSLGQPQTSPPATTGTSGIPILLGGVSLPGSGGATPPPVAAEAPIVPKPVPQPEPQVTPSPESAPEAGIPHTETVPEPRADPTTKAATVIKPQNIVYKSVLTLFQNYTGARTPQALTALFSQATFPGIRQEPPVVLSDGVTKVNVSIDISATQAPNISVTGGKVASFKRENGHYDLEIIPDARTAAATVTILNQGSSITFPLTVAPPLDTKLIPSGRFSEAAFTLFLKGGDAAKGDVNGDGARNYLDDYIVAANYLVMKAVK